ncbi:MAG: hypothetical protein ACJASY_002300 [Halioglobus sp.]|jgi:hypothetical protein
MEIVNNVIDLFGKANTTDTSGDARDKLKDRWLAALEEDSLTLTDNSLSGDKGLGQHAAHRAELEQALAQSQRLGTMPSRLPGMTQPGFPGPEQLGQSGPPVNGVQMLSGKLAGQPQGMPMGMPANAGTPTARGPGQPALSMSAPGFGLRYEALLNQTRFMDVNIQVTQSKDGLTLWIRDFKQKYSSEVFQWTKSLENLLREKGQSLSRIMLNGKTLTNINAIFGGNHGN